MLDNMLRMKTRIWVVIACLAGMTCCQKDVQDNHDKPFLRLLTEIRENGTRVTEFKYDLLNRLIMLNNYRNDTVIYTESYQYDGDNRLSKRIFPGFTETYQYTIDGRLKSTTLDYPATDKEWRTEFHYTCKKITRGITFFNDSERGYIEYKYDANGNTIERSEYHKSDGEEDFLDEQFKFSYDDKINPLKNPSTFPADIFQKNNPVYYYHYLSIMSSPPPEYQSTYEYDDQGYPISEMRGSRTLTYHYRSPGPIND